MLVVFLCVPAVSAFESEEDSMISRNWGKSFQAAKRAQIINPDAGRDAGRVEGFNGGAAQRTMEAYHESFTQEQARQGYTLDNIGVMVGGSK